MSDNFFSSSTSNGFTSFAPTVGLSGGTGNVVPVYSTNSAFFFRLTSFCYVQTLLTGDGGAEGAGTGAITIALPTAAAATISSGSFTTGFVTNGTNIRAGVSSIGSGASISAPSWFDTATTLTPLNGVDQNNTTRTIRQDFIYGAPS